MNAIDIYQIIMNSFDKNEGRYKLIIWVGAGIDNDAPTNLPLGYELTEFMIVNSMPDHLLHKYQKYKSASKKKKMIVKTYGQLRLETVIEAFRVLENSLLDKNNPHPFLRGFLSFENRQPNSIHKALAKLLRDGANIVTANYDNCINNAYYQLTGDQLMCKRDCSSTFHKGFYTYSSSIQNTGTIYHFHGVAHDIESLGASLTQLCNGLNLNFEKKIKFWIENGYTFLFLGYSGGDALDVNPFFQRLDNKIGKTAIFLRYNNQYERNISLEFMSKYERVLLKPFINKIVFEGTILKILNINSKKYYKPVEKKWNDSFFEKGETLNSNERLLVTMILCYLLGLNTKKILPSKWWIQVKKCKEVDPWLINFYGHELANAMNNQAIASYFDYYNNNSALEISNELAAKNDIKGAISIFGDMKEIFLKLRNIIKNDTMIIDWNISTPLNRMTDYVIETYHLNKLDIQELIESLYLIIINRNKIIDILQYATALRAYGILLVLYKKNTQGIIWINESLELYKEINSQRGIIKTLLYLKRCYVFYPINFSKINLLLKRAKINIEIIVIILTFKQFQYIKAFISSMSWIRKVCK